MLSLQHQSSGGHHPTTGGPVGLAYDGAHHPRGPAHPNDDSGPSGALHHPPPPLHHAPPHDAAAIYGSAAAHHGGHPGEGQSAEEGAMSVVPHPGMHHPAAGAGYPEGLQFAGYPPQPNGEAGAVQPGYPYMMGSLLQGQQYAIMPSSEDAVYVNQKQYHRILKRRQARMRLEAKWKITPRKEWLHDSRHQHAKNRQRGPGGRFLSKDERERYAQGAAAADGEGDEEKSNENGSSPSS